MNVGIVGSRNFSNLEYVEDFILQLHIANPIDLTIISGNAPGVDKTAENYAHKNGIPVLSLPANWDEYGRRAGYLRNIKIVDNSDLVVAFWDGKSKGTQHSINLARQKGKKLIIIRS